MSQAHKIAVGLNFGQIAKLFKLLSVIMDPSMIIPESDRLVMPRREAHTPVDDGSAQAVPLPSDYDDGIRFCEQRHVNLHAQLDWGEIPSVPLSPYAAQLEQDALRRASQRTQSLLSMPGLYDCGGTSARSRFSCDFRAPKRRPANGLRRGKHRPSRVPESFHQK